MRVDVPVTVKMRLGWDDADRNAPRLARELESEGVQAIAVHGRTRAQFYEGRADWRFIGEVKAAVSIPVLANGDVRTAADAVQILNRLGCRWSDDRARCIRAAVGRGPNARSRAWHKVVAIRSKPNAGKRC